MIRVASRTSAVAVTAAMIASGTATAEPSQTAASPTSLTDAAFTRAAAGDRTGAQAAIDALPRDRAAQVVAIIANVDAALNFPLTDQVPSGIVPGAAVVILGFGLEPDGSLRSGLVDRLRQGLSVAQAYPDLPVVVSGGNPRGGHTEASAMRDWLIEAGLPPRRILIEGTSTATATNAINTAALLRNSGITAGAVLVTSPDHLRRAVADFLVAGVTLQSVLACPGADAVPGPTERAAIYTDARRVAGI
ncbi:YdcF family protein [Mycolicibacterium aubagnense]|uniref:DUF218 domain-containing protein n=1 Tax=Mycolicibacterium aubagnense TaxID=319707 RepID=A0ABN5YPY8_9MYCO|nr:YdcF family protein [Mycolicibacterium aubagnense]TLH64428.1 YdcF family protein [Mycolicibacterium aubagnense]BBX82159.1 hypothetical protein MAUB_00320 [Mycolicibacterium aubagnense]